MLSSWLVLNSTNGTHREKGMLSCRPKTEHFDTVAVNTHKEMVRVTQMHFFDAGGCLLGRVIA